LITTKTGKFNHVQLIGLHDPNFLGYINDGDVSLIFHNYVSLPEGNDYNQNWLIQNLDPRYSGDMTGI
jgi:hypothetical protein